MSQIIFIDTNSGRLVQTGYDRILSYVHFTVFDKDGEVAYSELDTDNAFNMTVEDVITTCEKLNIDYPPYLRELLQEHVDQGLGNHVVSVTRVEQGGKVEWEQQVRQ